MGSFGSFSIMEYVEPRVPLYTAVVNYPAEDWTRLAYCEAEVIDKMEVIIPNGENLTETCVNLIDTRSDELQTDDELQMVMGTFTMLGESELWKFLTLFIFSLFFH